MARIVSDLTLGHRANAGEDVLPVELDAGSEVRILAEWSDHYLVKDDVGRLFNVAKDAVALD